jgi:hypothetical protein
VHPAVAGKDSLGGRLAPIYNLTSVLVLYRGPELGLFWARVWGDFRARGGPLCVCAKRKEFKTAFDSRSIAPESLHETMFREHVFR